MRLNQVSRIFAVGLAFLGVMILLGWLMDIPPLKNTSIKVNSALCFMWCGFTLFFLNDKKQNKFTRSCSVVFPLLIIVIGILTLTEYSLEVNIGIDEFFVKDDVVNILPFPPGRISSVAALCFILSGICLLLLYKNRAFLLFQTLCFIILSFGLLAFIGYIYQVDILQKSIANYTQMYGITSLVFIIFSIGMLYSEPDKGLMGLFTNSGFAGITIRRILPVIIFITIVLGWLGLLGLRAGYYNIEFGIGILVFTTIVLHIAITFWTSNHLFLIDIERKKAEEQVKSNQIVFSTVFYKSPVMNGITDVTTGKFIEVNENFVEFCGFTKEETLGKSSLDLNLISHPEHRKEIINSLKEKGWTRDVIMEIKNKKGETKWVSTSAHLVIINGKECFITAMVDISERKNAEDQLLLVNKELESFSYSISHDLRAPLRAISGNAKILEEDYGDKFDSEGLSSLRSIMNNSKKMGELIDDLLAFSKLGRKQVTSMEINMNSLVESVKGELLLEDNGNKIEFTMGILLPAFGDPILIKQVWANLISNAIKYSKYKLKSCIEIGSYEENNFVTYYIKDNGAGFEMQYYDKLFGVFQRLHSEEEFEGTGIGLAIVQKIIHKHSGHVWAESKVKEGTCFYFTLPARQAGFSNN